jgi:hypothetical protein
MRGNAAYLLLLLVLGERMHASAACILHGPRAFWSLPLVLESIVWTIGLLIVEPIDHSDRTIDSW